MFGNSVSFRFRFVPCPGIPFHSVSCITVSGNSVSFRFASGTCHHLSVSLRFGPITPQLISFRFVPFPNDQSAQSYGIKRSTISLMGFIYDFRYSRKFAENPFPNILPYATSLRHLNDAQQHSPKLLGHGRLGLAKLLGHPGPGSRSC